MNVLLNEQLISSQIPLTVFKGGTAFNGVLREFQKYFPNTTYIVPITDDGGSSREIWRVFGGPSIGDVRSTLTRLSDEGTKEARAVKKLLEHRLDPEDHEKAMVEWHKFLEDDHPLYVPLSSKYKGLIRCFLCKFEAERLLRISSRFDLRNGSIGNFFFSGARLALGSLETAIFVYSSVAQISASTHVLPIIDSNDRLGIGVNLENGETLISQHEISHPTLHGHVDKKNYIPLPSRIKNLFYVDKYKNVINPQPHPEVIRKIEGSKGLIYGMGSLWTSIIPSLVLDGVGEAISSQNFPKIVLLNSCQDRETFGLTALDYINNITNSLNRNGDLDHPPRAYVTDLFVVEGSEIPVDEFRIQQLGIRIKKIPADSNLTLSIQNEVYPVYASQELIRSVKHIVDDT